MARRTIPAKERVLREYRPLAHCSKNHDGYAIWDRDERISARCASPREAWVDALASLGAGAARAARVERPGGCGAARVDTLRGLIECATRELDRYGVNIELCAQAEAWLAGDVVLHENAVLALGESLLDALKDIQPLSVWFAQWELERPGGCGALRFPKFFSIDDAKAVKAQRETHDWLNAINYMAPAETAGVGNLCPWASAGCRALCLGTESGQAAMRREGEDNSVTRSRKAKAQFYMRERRAFMAELAVHIEKARARALGAGRRLCVRLNGSTDIAWESASVGGERLMDLFSDVQFTDYTKSARRMMRSLRDATWPDNYHLTFSRSEDNEAECKAVLAAGGNVAVVFGEGVPGELWGVEVVDGDTHDLRHLDGMGVVVGLTPKGNKAKRDVSGFVLRQAA